MKDLEVEVREFLVEVICRVNSNTTTCFILFYFKLCRICIVKIEYIVLAFFLSQGGVSKGVLPVYGKRGDKTQT